MSSDLVVKTGVFEGPLDLLLELIEQRKLHISDIALATVTDDYIARVNGMGEMPLGEASEFVALAATLLLIKSRSLLPSLEISGEEEHDIKELQYRLALYQIIKKASGGLRSALDNAYLFQPEKGEQEPVFVPDQSTTVDGVHKVMLRIIEEFPKVPILPKVAVEKAITLEEMIEKLSSRISSAIRLSFKDFSGHGKGSTATREKREIVVSFLALLELVKQGIIRATQHQEFGDITLEHDQVSTPTYE